MLRILAASLVAVLALAGCSDGSVSVDDANVEVSYPDEWTEVPPSIVKSELEGQLEGATDEVRSAYELVMEEIDSGVVRSVVISPPTEDGFTETMFVSIEEGDADLDAAADRRIERMQGLAASIDFDLLDVDLPIGPARRVEAFSEPQGGSPTHLIEYIVMLPDGRTLTLTGTSPSSDESFADRMAVMAESLEGT
jgi:hypothetical protein